MIAGERALELADLGAGVADLDALWRMGPRAENDQPLVSVRHYALDRLLARTADTPEASDFVRQQIGPLITWDRQHQGDLLTVLEAGLDIPRHEEAAAHCFMHRNTFRHRFRHATTILGDSLEDPETCVSRSMSHSSCGGSWSRRARQGRRAPATTRALLWREAMVTRIPLSELGDTTADRILGHRPELLAAWDALKHALVGSSSTLSPELKEQVRRTLALHTGCEFCASLGPPAAEQPDPKDSLAVAFAEAVATDHTAISDAQLELLFEEFTIPQVVELLTWISFEYAGQMFGALIGDEPATAEQRAAFEVSVAAQPRP